MLPLRTAHRTARLFTPRDRGVLEIGESSIMPLKLVNLDRLTLAYQQLDVAALTTGNVGTTRQQRELLDRAELQGDKDTVIQGQLGIRDILGDQSGLVWGSLDWAPNGPREPRQFSAQVTPWNVCAKVGYYDSLVWVTRLADGSPVADANVSLFEVENESYETLKRRENATVTTDKDGLAKLPGVVDFSRTWWDWEAPDIHIGVTRANEMALLPLTWAYGRSIYRASHGEVFSDTAEQGDRMRAWAVTAQGIYKPGSDVQYAVFLRREGETTLMPAPANEDANYELTITNPEGDTLVDAQPVRLSDYGDVNGAVHVPETAPMGWYTIHLAWYDKQRRRQRDAGRFLVTDFVPASFQVRTDIQGKSLHPGSVVTSHVNAKLHAGGPYTAAKTVFKTRLIPRHFTTDNPAAAGFTFGTGERLPDSKTLAEHETVLDQQGEAKDTFQLPEDLAFIYGDVKVEGVVASARGKSVSHSASLPFSARDRFVGLRTPNWMQTAQETFDVDYVVTDAQGVLQPEEEVLLTLERENVHRVREKTAGGDYGHKEETEWIIEATCKGVTAVTPQRCDFTPKTPGRYRVLAIVEDSQGRPQQTVLKTYVAGAGTTVWSQEDEIVTLVPDQSEYHVGDTARVMVQNPYPGAQALVTVERYGVLWQKLLTLQGSAPIIEVPIEKAAFPGAYLSVTLFSPRVSPVAVPDLGKPVIAQGYMPLKVTGQGSQLNVAVHSDKSEYRPGESVKVQVAVTDGQDAPAAKARLLVAAVDQGILDLLESGKHYYDPRASFYAPPDGPDMENYSLVEQLLSDLEAKEGKGESPSAGGGDAGPKLRDDFTHAAFWHADLETDANGQAQFEFTLPDNLTRWRIFVIALQADDAMGVGDASVRSNLPLQILPALPNQLRVGDSFSAGFEVTNRTDHRLTANTHIQATGAIDETAAEADKGFTLNAFDRALAWLPLTVAHTGQIRLQATAEADSDALGHLGDGMVASIPVRHAGSEVTSATYGSMSRGSKTVPIQMPDNAIDEGHATEVVFSPTLLGGLDGAFVSLRDNPYNNWEVRLSRAVLAAYYQSLKEIVGAIAPWEDAEQVITDTLAQARNFQASNGGMAFWAPRQDFVSDYLSVYTALAFTWLDHAGYALPDKVAEKLRGYLQETLLGREDDAPIDKTVKAGAFAALAQSSPRQLEMGEVADLAAHRHELLLFGNALLLSAAVAVDDKESATALLETIFSHAEESGGTLSFNEQRSDGYARLLDTPLRANCAILSALVEYKRRWGDKNLLSDTPQKLMRWVVGERNLAGHWPNSQENVFCVRAIRQYAKEYESPVNDLTGVLQVSDNVALKAHFDTRTVAAEVLAGPKVAPGEAFSLSLAHEGAGRLYYNARVRYILPPDAVTTANAGMVVKRHYHIQRDGGWQPVTKATELKRGDIVRIDLEVSTPTRRHHVVLTDPLPGAFEAMNRELATIEEDLPAKESDGREVVMFDGGAWPDMRITAGGFYHREMAHDAVRFHADALPAGNYRLVYSAQVMAPGQFTAPAPSIELVYQPDVFGRGEPMQLQVTLVVFDHRLHAVAGCSR